jgi:hypothetical protein
MVRLLPWILEAIVLFFVIRMVLQTLGRGRRVQRGKPRSPEAQSHVPERLGGTLVRDPHCGTYILESTALQVRAGHETLHFCSAACRDAYRQRA